MGGAARSRSSTCNGKWNLASSLAAAMAAGAYTVHHPQLPPTSAFGQAQQLQGRAPAGEEPEKEDSSSQAAASGSSSSTSTSPAPAGRDGSSSSSHKAAGAAECGDFSGSPTGATACPGGCSTCVSATQLFFALRCLEHGTMPIVDFRPEMAAGVLLKAAQQQGLSPQQHLQQQLQALAWRHPVPCVCGNVLCGRLKKRAAVGAVQARVDTLCGGCRAAWYCCEGCQKAAWPGHWVVCRNG
jgi:hypothetical protein